MPTNTTFWVCCIRCKISSLDIDFTANTTASSTFCIPHPHWQFGGPDGDRTRDLWRDRPAFYPAELPVRILFVIAMRPSQHKVWQGRKGSNLRMSGSKPDAVPLGYSPTRPASRTVTQPSLRARRLLIYGAATACMCQR